MIFFPLIQTLKTMGLKQSFYLFILLNGIIAFLSYRLDSNMTAIILFAFNSYLLAGILNATLNDIKLVNGFLVEDNPDNTVKIEKLSRGILPCIARGVLGRDRKEYQLQASYKDINSEISHSSQELHTTAQKLKNNIKEQSLSTSSIAAAVTEISYNTDDISKRVNSVYQAANDSGEMSKQGREIIKSARTHTEEVAAYAKQTYELLSNLDQNTATVANMSTVIREIAEQTNLLALNAAIEAARAGEYGRGFAVVADEVRTLATRSHESAQEISQNIDNVQLQMKAVKNSMDNVMACTNQSVDKAQETESLLEKIAEHSQTVTDLLYAIASSTEQQTTAIKEISCNIEDVAVLADKNSQIADQSASIAGHVKELCEHSGSLLI